MNFNIIYRTPKYLNSTRVNLAYMFEFMSHLIPMGLPLRLDIPLCVIDLFINLNEN